MSTTNHTSCWLWQLDPEIYNPRIIATSEAGLGRVIARVLTATKLFPSAMARAEIVGVRDCYGGHFDRAYRSRRQVDFGRGGCWQLLNLREVVEPLVEKETIDAIDLALAPYICCTLLAPETYWTDQFPGQAEWWWEAGELAPIPPPLCGDPVVAALTVCMELHLKITKANLIVTPFNEWSEVLGRGVHGTYLVARWAPEIA